MSFVLATMMPPLLPISVKSLRSPTQTWLFWHREVRSTSATPSAYPSTATLALRMALPVTSKLTLQVAAVRGLPDSVVMPAITVMPLRRLIDARGALLSAQQQHERVGNAEHTPRGAAKC